MNCQFLQSKGGYNVTKKLLIIRGMRGERGEKRIG